MELDVPALVRQRALANGSAGRSWLGDLPDVVAGLVERWGLELGNFDQMSRPVRRCYTAAELKVMYRNHGRYVSQVTNIFDSLVADGYVLEVEAEAEIRAAARSTVGR